MRMIDITLYIIFIIIFIIIILYYIACIFHWVYIWILRSLTLRTKSDCYTLTFYFFSDTNMILVNGNKIEKLYIHLYLIIK